MAEVLYIDPTLSKSGKYEQLLSQIVALTETEKNALANMSNIIAALKYGMGYFWVGLYFVDHEELVLGPFQGPVACTRITKGKGVCGQAWKNKKNIIVDDVNQFQGHISCNSASRSEIVIPGKNRSGEVAFVLDIDSDKLSDFDHTDENYLEKIVHLIEKLL